MKYHVLQFYITCFFFRLLYYRYRIDNIDCCFLQGRRPSLTVMAAVQYRFPLLLHLLRELYKLS